MNFADFHFLRPEWFYALLPALFVYVLMKLRQGKNSAWERTIDPELLSHLLEDRYSKPSRNPATLLLLSWMLAVAALAGPVWEQLPRPVHEREDALIIVLDLSRSMYSTDVSPNRLVRARRKLLDLLETRNEGVTALVVYAGDAHVVSPLTDDAKTIAELIPAVSPGIMPAPGSQLAPALRLARNLFEDAGVQSGRILIVTDEIRDIAEAQSIARQFQITFPLSVLAVGTREGAPIRDPQSGYLRDASGNLVIPALNLAAMQEFAQIAGGRFAQMTLLDRDLDYLLAESPLPADLAYREIERDFDTWIEQGPWLLLLLLPLAALAFRRGWLWSLVLVALLPAPEANASLWDQLWLTPDQQGKLTLEQGDAATAAEQFESPGWKGSAWYRAENYQQAQEYFKQSADPTSQYNLGNSLARLGQYESAIKAYEQVLAEAPDHEDANFNKQLVEELLKKQQQEQSQENDQSDQDDQSESDQDQQSQSQDQNQEQGDEGSEEQDAEDADEQESEEQEAAEQQEAEQQEASDQQASEADNEPLSEEEQQALQQWLRKVPDDPGGLLRRKFELQHNDRIKQGMNTPYDASDW